MTTEQFTLLTAEYHRAEASYRAAAYEDAYYRLGMVFTSLQQELNTTLRNNQIIGGVCGAFLTGMLSAGLLIVVGAGVGAYVANHLTKAILAHDPLFVLYADTTHLQYQCQQRMRHSS